MSKLLLRPALVALGLSVFGCGQSTESTKPIESTQSPLTEAPSASAPGPYSVGSLDYKFKARKHASVLNDRDTEIWAKAYWPQQLLQGSERLPLIVMLHGNHGTCGTGKNPRYDFDCTYTDFGYCPKDHVVVPNHEGYDYLADRLASQGYFVLSVNANRGITCGSGVEFDWGLILARGRLILEHLAILSGWDSGKAPTCTWPLDKNDVKNGYCNPLPFSLKDRIDFLQVGLFGHSRGGEGMRAVLHEYLQPGSPWPARIGKPVWVRGIFEIGAVDGQSDTELNAQNVAWNQVIPMCDGDVMFHDGLRPYDRMLFQGGEFLARNKSYYVVWGANHNFFNTEWQTPDSPGCGDGHKPLWEYTNIGSPQQRAIAIESATGFFRAHVGTHANRKYSTQFNPLYAVPSAVSNITRINRAYTDTTRRDIVPVVDDLRYDGQSPYGFPHIVSKLDFVRGTMPRHDMSLPVAHIRWTEPGDDHYFETDFLPPGQGIDVRKVKTLDFRVGRIAYEELNEKHALSDLTVQFVHADGSLSTGVLLSDHLVLDGPGTGPLGFNQILWTVRIPLTSFDPQDLQKVRGVRFTFNKTETGGIYLTGIRASFVGKNLDLPDWYNVSDASVVAALSAPPVAAGTTVAASASQPTTTVTGSISALNDKGNTVEVVLASNEGKFPVTDALPQLVVDGQVFKLSALSSDLTKLTFKLPKAKYQQLADGKQAEVKCGARSYQLGALNKAQLQ